jgi:hypothetical protein
MNLLQGFINLKSGNAAFYISTEETKVESIPSIWLLEVFHRQ